MADKPSLTNISSGRLNPDTVDGNFDTLRDNHENLLGRGGSDESSNFMTGDLDLNKNRIKNVATPIAAGDAVSLAHLNTILGQGSATDGLIVVYEEFTATAGQTIFTFSDATYVQSVNNLVVYMKEASATEEGYRKLAPSAYEETSTSSFTLLSSASVGDKILAYIGQTIATTATEVVENANLAEASAAAAATSATEAATSATEAEEAAESITFPIPIGSGGTGEDNAEDALAALGVVLGTDPTDVPQNNNLGEGAYEDIADQSTAETGTNNEDLMTALRTYQQVTARIADQSTAETGTNNTGMMTPLRVAQAISALASAGINVAFQKQTTNVSFATDYTYSSLGFTPKLVLCIAYQPTDAACSVGFSVDESNAEFCLYGYDNASSPTASFIRGGSTLAYSRSHNDYGQQLAVKTWGSDSLVVTANKAAVGAYSTDFYLYIIG